MKKYFFHSRFLPLRRKTKERGFTLIELLIVVSIMGILASMALASYSNSQMKARDSRRKSDLDALKKSLNLAKLDTPGAYYFPSCLSYVSGSCPLTNTSTTPSLNSGTPPYMPSVPLDAKTSIGYTYTPSPENCTAGNCTIYTLKACLENSNDPQGTIDASCTESGKSYSVTN